MSKYEHLLGQDPIGAFDKIKKDYVRYFKTAYHIDNEIIEDMRMKAIEIDDNLYKEPYLEVLPEYETYPGINNIEDLAFEFKDEFGSEVIAKEFFEKFIKTGLMSYKPYGHQVGMLKKAFVDKKNVVITSGTGSGKTESFLLPLFAQLFKEAKAWPNANYPVNWYSKNGNKYIPCQRENESSDRPAALRALVLYPMNALVADQMSRLRKALDSDKVRTYMHNFLGDNRIFFGGYNGQTIGAKNFELLDWEPDRKGKEQKRVAEKLDDIYSRFSNITRYYNDLQTQEEKDDKEEVLYVNPRLDDTPTAEMLTRWDMQNTPPDIMITNVSMLSIMLMRKAEEGLFEMTKQWLAADSSHIFHLIIDELHLYRGTSGSEVACLIRMLLDTLGLRPTIEKKDEQGNVINDDHGHPILVPNPQLRILASSASLGSTERGDHGEKSETEKYLEEFFGVYNSDCSDAFEVQKGTNYCPKVNEKKAFDFTIFNEIKPEFIELDDEAQLKQMNAFAQRHQFESIKDFTLQNQEFIFAKIYEVIPKNGDKGKTPRAISLSNLATSLFDGIDTKGETPALRGFLIYRAFVDKLNENGTIKQKREKSLVHRLPRIRFHQFFKYIEGLWGELQPTIGSNGSRALDENGKEISPIKSVVYEAQEVGKSGTKILELLRCENCGELFLGGNRRSGRDEVITLNYPDLTKMPNFNPTPMVQNKSYKDYIIFWPTHKEPEQDLNEQVAVLGSGKYAFSDTNGRGNWAHAYVHIKTGVIKSTINNEPDKESYIEGYKYIVKPDKPKSPLFINRIQALPCCCPHCAMDYARRIHVKSPIRSFRTGIDRSNQLLSKELMYQLSEKSQKLIGFSDSREDAAKQAYGIELEQYRDMVRMLFIDCVNEINGRVQMVIDQVEADKSIGIDVKDYFYPEKFTTSNIPEARLIAMYYIAGRDLSNFKKDYVDLSYFIDNNQNINGLLVRKLVELGINPAGVDYKDQYTNDIRTDQYHWNRAFDWETFARKDQADANYRERVYNNLTTAIFANSFGKYMGVSVLDSGIGYVCCKRIKDKENTPEYTVLDNILKPLGLNVYDFIDAFIRILGDNYRYSNDDFEEPSSIGGYNGKSGFGKYKKYIRAVADKYNTNEIELGDALFNYFNDKEGAGVKLLYSNLAFRLLDENAEYYECPICHRVHPNKGMGVCTCCAARLPDEPVQGKKVKDLWEHFISYDILVEKKKARRLHTEELTGQTDDIQTRLLEFKNLILLSQSDKDYRTGEERTKEIDMVNVTTTMEVGVDIGSLEAIFQGNMSPTRYNYQQRVGRGGRRGQAFSTAVTFCRGRSHDVHYYKNATDEIVGGLPSAPKLSLAPYVDNNGNQKLKLAIIKRVIAKNILRVAFKEKEIGYDTRLHDTSGEFGLPLSWNTNKPLIKDWINNNSNKIDEIIDLYTAQFNTEECNIMADIDELKGWAKGTGLLDEVSAIANRPTYAEGLAQSLAEGGLLPMYGMPSDLREFYHGVDKDPKVMDLRSISRSTEMAINEFAPGSDKTKDKGKYRVEGISTPLRYEEAKSNHSERIVSMNPLDVDALYNCYIMHLDPSSMQDISTWRIENVEINNDVLISKAEIAANLQQNEKMLIIPMAYRSYKLFENNGKSAESNDRGSRFSQSTIFAKDNDNSTNSKDIKNVRISAYGLNLNDDADVWHINTNNNQLFKGKYASYNDHIDGVVTCQGKCPNCRSSYMDEKNGQYTCRDCGTISAKSDLVDFFSSNSYMFYKKMPTQGANAKEYLNLIPDGEKYAFDIAIGSRKPTEMIKLEIMACNDFVDINLTTGNESAIRAAFFSAAFLIQRTLADKLDVSPDEIEITDKIVNNRPVIYLSDAAPNGAGIVSYLYQENHLVEILKDITEYKTVFMQSLINNKHRQRCKTACQDCLLTYNNRGFHHVLDWRLGVSILRLMLDPNFDFGFNPATRSQYPELSDYDELVAECAQKLRQDWTVGNYHHEAKNMRNIKNMFIYNPLWHKVRLISLAKYDNVPTNQLAIFNTFRVLRSDMEQDILPENIDDIPARNINDQGQLVDHNTGLVLDIPL